MHTRIQQAIKWRKEHENESLATVARVFKLPRTTLSFWIRKATPCPKGGHNRILTLNQEKQLNLFIRSYLDHNLLPTKGVIVSAVTRLRALENKARLSDSWFQKWWKAQPLHKIKTKPIVRFRFTAQDKLGVKDWFKQYKTAVVKHNVERKDIWNFDETGFRVGCPKGQEI